jgi:hypothetical protein
MCCKTGLLFAARPDLKIAEPVVFSTVPSDGVIERQVWQAYAAKGAAADGGGRQRNLARRRKF